MAAVVSSIVFGLLSPATGLTSPPSNAFRFIHDPDGRLKAAIDPKGGTALYSWDAAGNLLSISRHESSELSVIQISPGRAQVGETVTIKGTGLSTTPSANTVKFNGTSASVTAATLTTLTVKVPAEATSGTVTVATAGEGPVSSPESFTVTSSSAPQVSSISPTVAAAGEEVTLSGSNFEASAYGNVVTVNGAQAQVASATSTSLKFLVPSARLGGGISVATQEGSAGGPDLFIPPAGAAASSVGATGRVSLGGSTTAEVKEAGKVALILVDGTEGQQISLVASEAGFSGEARLYTPNGPQLGSSPNFSKTSNSMIGPVTLPETGTYTVHLQDTAGAGTVKLTAYTFEDIAGSITPTKEGASQATTITTPGQVANYTVEVKAGQQLSVKTSSSTMNGEYCVSWRTAAGAQISQKCHSGTASGFWGQQTFSPTPGTYTLRVDPTSTTTGSVTLTVWDATDITGTTITPTTEGESKSLKVEAPGQKNWVTFAGTAGQKVTMLASEASFSGEMRILTPAGSVLGGAPNFSKSASALVNAVTLPESGTYKVKLEGSGEATGTVKLTAYTFEDIAGSITPTKEGASQATTITTPGQVANYTVEVKAGQQLSVKTSSSTMNGEYCVSWRTAAGAQITQKCHSGTGSGFWQQQTFNPTPGTYVLRVDPTGTTTGSVTLTVWDATDITGTTITPTTEGESKSLKVEAPGQKNWVTFAGTKGQLVTLKVTEPSFAGTMSTWAPSGSKVSGSEKSFASGGSAKAEITPAETGTYKVKLEGSGEATGTLKLTAYLGSHAAWFGPVASTATLVSYSGPPSGPETSYSDVPKVAPRHHKRIWLSGASQLGEASWLPRSVSAWRPEKRGAWLPPRSSFQRGWVVGQSPGPWTRLAPLQAPAGTTAVSGRVLKVDGLPLVGARISVKGTSIATRTDVAGRFLLSGAPSGRQIFVIDGETAPAKRRYGSFEAGVELPPHKTTVLDYTTWMTPLDRAGDHAIASPTRRETRITTPRIPGFEVRIPGGTVIRNAAGDPVKRLNITAIPVNRPAFPLPPFLSVPLYFTVQPGRAYLSKGARVIYPNWGNLPPGQRVDFWNYDPTDRGWYVYGRGEVTPDGRQVVPDPGVRVWQFTGAMVVSSAPPPEEAPGLDGASAGDPVDLHTGLFTYHRTDFVLPDVIPIRIERTYRTKDSNSYSFGRGMTSPYDLRLWSTNSEKEADLILPDGGRVHFVRTSPGSGETDAVFEAAKSPSVFSKAKITYAKEGSGWDLTLTNGTTYVFDPFVLAPLREIRDRHGNSLKFTWSAENITQITSPNGRWVKFTYDVANRITEITDNGGRHFKYAYTSGKLTKFEAPGGRTTEYEYDASNRMKAIVNARGNKYLQNEYDANGRVEKQIAGDGAIFEFAYELNEAGKVKATTVTDPLGNQRKVSFNSEGFPTSETEAPGTELARTTSFERQGETGLVLSETDPLGRKTAFDYDSSGNVIEVTKLAGTEDATTTKFKYAAGTSYLTEMADPLGHATKYEYGPSGELLKKTDPLGHETLVDYNADGQPTSTTNPEGEETKLAYRNGDLVSVTDPAGRVTTRFVDTLGRLRSLTAPGGQRVTFTHNDAGETTSVKTPSGAETAIAYDADGNPTSITDPRGNKTTMAYDVMDRLVSETDPLENTTEWSYDKAGDVEEAVDRNGKVATFAYDQLRRMTTARYGVSGLSAESSIGYDYDLGNRVTQVTDSTSGEYVFNRDPFGRIESLEGPGGTVSYAYDAAGRREAMFLPGQAPLYYSYDNADQLTGLSRGSESVALSYDKAGRPTAVTLPNDITQEYAYDASGKTTAVTYKHEESTLGAIDYAYDSNGLLEATWGSFARLNLPQSLNLSEYNADNELVEREGVELGYDKNGNLLSDGANEYSWNARGQLTNISGEVSATFAYDPFGRRTSKTLGGTTTDLLYDVANVALESQEGETTAALLGGLQADQLFARTTASGTDSYLTDRLGSTVALANSSAEVTTSYSYEPFGAPTAAGAGNDNPYQFTGRDNDETGLQYNRARYYSFGAERFISQDPASFAGSGANLYWYVADDPLDFTDPTGECLLVCVPNPFASLEDAAEQVGEWVSEAPGVLSEVWAATGRYIGSCLSNAMPAAVLGGIVGAVDGAGYGIVPGAVGGAALGCGQGLFQQGLRDIGPDVLAEVAEGTYAAVTVYQSGRLFLRQAPGFPQRLREVAEIFS